jgi:5-methylcytosine-specific restriction endonuclease McrA
MPSKIFRPSVGAIYPKKWCDDYSVDASERRRRRLERARYIGTHTKVEWQAMRAVFIRCPCCDVFGYRAVKDHITSLFDGGSDAIENIQPLCMHCNASKNSYSHDFRDDADPDWVEKYLVIFGILQEIDWNDRMGIHG